VTGPRARLGRLGDPPNEGAAGPFAGNLRRPVAGRVEHDRTENAVSRDIQQFASAVMAGYDCAKGEKGRS